MPDRSVFVPIYQQTPAAVLKPNTKQIAIFGGSSVHGGSIGVSSSNEFAGILNKRLPIQVNNFGAPSLDSHDILRISKELIEFSSTGWVLYTGHNDFGNAFFLQRYQGWGNTLWGYETGYFHGSDHGCKASKMMGYVIKQPQLERYSRLF